MPWLLGHRYPRPPGARPLRGLLAPVQQPPCSDALALRLPPSALARQRRLPSRRSPIVAARRLLPSCAAEAALLLEICQHESPRFSAVAVLGFADRSVDHPRLWSGRLFQYFLDVPGALYFLIEKIMRPARKYIFSPRTFFLGRSRAFSFSLSSP